MTVELTPEAWTQVRYEYEHTDKPVDDICLDHGVSPSTLRDRMRRWGWTRRRQPVPAEGPPPSPPSETAADALAPPAATSADPPADPAEIERRLQGAVARVLPAIETTIGKLAAGPMPPRDMERAARTLTALTRTLRELNGLLSQYPAPPADDRPPDDPDEFALDLVRRMNEFAASHAALGAAGDRPAGS